MIGMEGKTLRSRRLTYRLLEQEDRPALRELLRLPEVTCPAGFRPARNEREFDRFFAELTQYRAAIGVFAEQTLIGYFHVNPYHLQDPIYAEKHCVGVGFVIGKDHQGKGYGGEMLRTLTGMLKERFDFCFADYFEGNEPSRRVIEKCGYRFYERYTMTIEELGQTFTCVSNVY